jgi:signal peptidase II
MAAGTNSQSLDPGLALSWRVLKYWRLLLVAAAVVALDQWSKNWIVHHLAFGAYGADYGAITVVPGFFYIVHVGNTGAAWSIFSGRSLMLAALAAVTLVVIFVWRKALGIIGAYSQLCFGLLCGGITGNLVDRVMRGHVVDFLDFHFGRYVYPTFNIADSAICVGVGLYVISTFRSPRRLP